MTTIPNSPVVACRAPKPGVLALFGYNIQVHVNRGHLLVDDGIGFNRRQYRLSRVGHGLRRLVIVGSDGMISLSALRWLADQDCALTFLERDGKVLTTTGPVRPSDSRLRRAQSLSSQSHVALRIARELIDKKLVGQEQVARQKLNAPEKADAIYRFRSELAEAETIDSVRLVESRAATAYWAAWRGFPVNFPRKDEKLVPAHWREFGVRISPLTGSPRLAVNPPNALLNFLYALLESESRLALAALGLDPGIGFLHVDTPYRDSLACDVMEPVRPQVDSYLLDWISQWPLRREWFFEQRDGNCRLMGSFAARLAETAPTWGRAVAPFAEWVAQVLRTPNCKPANGDQFVPTRLTQRRRSEGRGREYVPDSTPAPHPRNVCRGCGTATVKGSHCEQCARDISREKLIDLAKIGRLIAQNPRSRTKLSQTQKRRWAAQKKWEAMSNSERLTEQFYTATIQPRLASFSISQIASAIGVSEVYAGALRKGRYRPHPRHWETLARLANISFVQ